MPGSLAAIVRAKFPGAYDDLDDAALEQSVLSKYPEYADLATPAPDFKTSNEKDAGGNAVVSTWGKLNTPLLPQIAEAAHAIATYMSGPSMGDQQLNDRVPGLGTFSAALRGGGAGIVEGVGELGSALTTPIGIALSLAGLRPSGATARAIPGVKHLLSLPAVQMLQRASQVAGGAAFAGHGAQQVVTAPDLAGKARGVAEMAGGAAGALSAVRSGKSAPAATPTQRLTPADAASNAFAERQGIPLDPATATGSGALRAVQKRVSHTLGGEPSALRLLRQQQEGLARVGTSLADETRGVAVTPEAAGNGIREALASKGQAHTALADASYEQLRALEEHPSNRMSFPTAKQPVDQMPAPITGELRRIVHEMDASGYTAGKNLQDNLDTSGTTYVHRTGGAAVFHDIADVLGYEPTRAQVQAEIEAFLGGSKPTAIVKAAQRVAEERAAQRDGRKSSVSRPEMPISATQDLTRLEKTRVTSEDIGLPVDTTEAKKALRPVYDQMMRQMPLTQQQANPGLKAIANILDGPDYAPLSVVDRDLSAIKALARQHGGLSKFAAGALDRAVKRAAANGGPEVVRALETGRQATIGKVQTEGLIESLPGGKMEEPVAVFKRATAPKDGGIEFLRAIKEQTPQAVPQIARAKLDEFLSTATERGGFDHADKLYAEWQKLGSETKKILFPKAGQTQELDHFFLLAKRLAENPNPSGTAHVSKALDLLYSLGTYPLAKVLYTPRGVRAISRFLSQTGKTAAAATSASPVKNVAQTAGWIEVLAAARKAGVPLDLPQAASSRTPEERR